MDPTTFSERTKIMKRGREKMEKKDFWGGKKLIGLGEIRDGMGKEGGKSVIHSSRETEIKKNFAECQLGWPCKSFQDFGECV